MLNKRLLLSGCLLFTLDLLSLVKQVELVTQRKAVDVAEVAENFQRGQLKSSRES
jgi:hypothetical protein